MKAQERLVEIFMETGLSHTVTGSDLRIVAQEILKEFIPKKEYDEAIERMDWYDNLVRDKVQGKFSNLKDYVQDLERNCIHIDELPKEKECEKHPNNENAYLCMVERKNECSMCKQNNAHNQCLADIKKLRGEHGHKG